MAYPCSSKPMASQPPTISLPKSTPTNTKRTRSDRRGSDTTAGISSIVPNMVSQDVVENTPMLKQLQQDLLLVTSFADNSTLRWRPSWFQQGKFSSGTWTLHNPPDVVTERLPNSGNVPHMHTRRMRLPSDPPPLYIKDWNHWKRYREMYGIPPDFLNKRMVRLLRLGLKKTEHGNLGEPPTWPLYPEPQPKDQGRYLLSPTSYHLLPKKFEAIDPGQIIVVHSNGRLEVTDSEPFYFHASQWTQYNGTGSYIDIDHYDADPDAPKLTQGKGRRWAYLPWTKEQEQSCESFKLKLRFWNSYVKYPNVQAEKQKKKRLQRELEDGLPDAEAMIKRRRAGSEKKRQLHVDEGYVS